MMLARADFPFTTGRAICPLFGALRISEVPTYWRVFNGRTADSDSAYRGSNPASQPLRSALGSSSGRPIRSHLNSPSLAFDSSARRKGGKSCLQSTQFSLCSMTYSTGFFGFEPSVAAIPALTTSRSRRLITPRQYSGRVRATRPRPIGSTSRLAWSSRSDRRHHR